MNKDFLINDIGFSDSEFVSFKYLKNSVVLVVKLWNLDLVEVKLNGVKFFEVNEIGFGVIPRLVSHLEFNEFNLDYKFTEKDVFFLINNVDNINYMKIVADELEFLKIISKSSNDGK